MYNLLFILYTITLGKISIIDISTLISIIVLIGYIYRAARSRVTKNDMDLALINKANKDMVIGELKLRDERIKRVEDLSLITDKYLKDTLEEQHAILDTVQQDIKLILKQLN